MSEDDVLGHGGCEGLAAPYVLGALGEAEHESFLRHLETCAVCREEVASLQMVAAALPAAAPQLSAPAEIKRRVMASVREEAPSMRAAEAVVSRERRAATPRTRPNWMPVFGSLAAAAAVAIIALVLLGGGSGGSTRVIRAEVTAPGAAGTVSVSSNRAQLTLTGMPQTSPGHVYEVWVKRGGAPAPTDALFTVASDGHASVGIPGSVAGVKEVMVTVEPLGGTRVPTTEPVVIAKLS